MRSFRPTPSLVISLVALFVALGGTSYAVATNAIGSKQVKDNSIRSKDIANNSITGTDVHNGSLRSSDFKAGQLSTGARGPMGPQGPTGPAGADGMKELRQVSALGSSSSGTSSAKAQCAPDERAVSGGSHVNISNGANPVLQTSEPMDAAGSVLTDGSLPKGGGWYVTYYNNAANGTIQTFAYAVCAKP